MGIQAAKWAHQQRGLKHARVILLDAAWSCFDDSGFLDRDRQWLATKCELSLRSLDRHLPRLEQLQFLVWNGKGFRLVEYLRQNGGQIVGQNVRAYKEGNDLDYTEKRRLNNQSSLSWPEDEREQIRAIAQRYRINDLLAEAVLYAGILGNRYLGKTGPIRSVEYFRNFVTEIQGELARGGSLSPSYMAYLRAKVQNPNWATEGWVTEKKK